jgi:nitroreductase
MDAIQALLSRASAAKLGEPAPSDENLDTILRCAMRAPDHGRLRPWRFLVIRGAGRRDFGDVLADSLRRQTPHASDDMLERERAKAMRAPLVVCVAAAVRHDSNIPRIEQILSAGAACENMMLAAYALGLGAMWKTGAAAYDDNVKIALGLTPADSIVGFIYVGTSSVPPKGQPQIDSATLVTSWPPVAS